MGIIRWVETIVSEPNFFSLTTDSCPVQLALLDEVVTCHPLLHNQVLKVVAPTHVKLMHCNAKIFFKLYIRLFEQRYESLEILAQMEIKKMLLDRLVNLLSRGYVIPVVNYIKTCWENIDTDISLIRCGCFYHGHDIG